MRYINLDTLRFINYKTAIEALEQEGVPYRIAKMEDERFTAKDFCYARINLVVTNNVVLDIYRG